VGAIVSRLRNGVVLSVMAALWSGSATSAPAQLQGLGQQLLHQAAHQAAAQAVQKALADGRPLEDSAPLAYPTSPLPGGAFVVHAWIPTRYGGAFIVDHAERLALQRWLASRDGAVTLAPGDYTFPVRVFCMKMSAHSPYGYHYRLAPLNGRLAQMIAALNTRTAFHPRLYPHGDVQMLSWMLQAGEKYGDLDAKLQRIVDAAVPEFKPLIEQSLLERVQSAAGAAPTGIGVISDLESLDAQVRSLQHDYSSFARFAVPQQEGSALMHLEPPDATPWSKIGESLYARFITKGNFSGTGALEVRVLPNGGNVEVPIGSLVAVPDRSLGSVALRTFSAESLVFASASQQLVAQDAGWEDGGVQPLSVAPEGPGTDPAEGPNPASFWGLLPPGADFGKVSVGVDTPIPGVGVSVSVAVDRFGQSYIGVGAGLGAGWPPISFSAVTGNVYTSSGTSPMTAGEMDGILSGWGWGGSTSSVTGASDVSANGSGTAIGNGKGTPGFSAGMGYTWDISPCSSGGC
jgi:hypothetical protein